MISRRELSALIDIHADRPAVLESVLRRVGAEPTRTALAGGVHIAVRFGESAYDGRFRTKLLVAHHDRVSSSPGALDNGAACLQLADLAGRLAGRTDSHNTVILFTDSEESSTVGDQGSFSVARALAGRVAAFAGEVEEPPAVFVFDVTGRGGVPVLSTTARDLLSVHSLEHTDLAGDIQSLGAWARRAIRKGSGVHPVELPVPWSDELGFALGGVPAVTVTLLPLNEIEDYRASLARLSGSEGAPGRYPQAMPYTWTRLHGPGDDISLLEESSFALMEGVLDAFAELKIPRVRRIRTLPED